MIRKRHSRKLPRPSRWNYLDPVVIIDGTDLSDCAWGAFVEVEVVSDDVTTFGATTRRHKGVIRRRGADIHFDPPGNSVDVLAGRIGTALSLVVEPTKAEDDGKPRLSGEWMLESFKEGVATFREGR